MWINPLMKRWGRTRQTRKMNGLPNPLNYTSLALVGSIFLGKEIGQALEGHVSVVSDRVRIEIISLWVQCCGAVLQELTPKVVYG